MRQIGPSTRVRALYVKPTTSLDPTVKPVKIAIISMPCVGAWVDLSSLLLSSGDPFLSETVFRCKDIDTWFQVIAPVLYG